MDGPSIEEAKDLIEEGAKWGVSETKKALDARNPAPNATAGAP
jgi:hypothetical protein